MRGLGEEEGFRRRQRGFGRGKRHLEREKRGWERTVRVSLGARNRVFGRREEEGALRHTWPLFPSGRVSSGCPGGPEGATAALSLSSAGVPRGGPSWAHGPEQVRAGQ